MNLQKPFELSVGDMLFDGADIGIIKDIIRKKERCSAYKVLWMTKNDGQSDQESLSGIEVKKLEAEFFRKLYKDTYGIGDLRDSLPQE